MMGDWVADGQNINRQHIWQLIYLGLQLIMFSVDSSVIYSFVIHDLSVIN